MSTRFQDYNPNTPVTAAWLNSADDLVVGLPLAGGAALVATMQSGAGAALRTVQAELRDFVKYSQYVLAGDTSAHQALQRAHDDLPSSGGTILLPRGMIIATAGITVTKDLRLKGEGKLMSTLKCTGNNGGQPFIKQTSGNVLGFEDMSFSGNGTTAGPIADAGSIGYQSFNNSYSQNCDMLFWETLSTWNSGFYHKHFNTYFEYCRTFFSGYDQNNLAFFGCRWANFQTGATIASGEGPITFVGGSIENIGDKAFTSAAGRQIALSLLGVYIENFPATACPSGITSTSGFFKNGILVYSNGPEIYPVIILGCTIFLPGIFRVGYFDSVVGCALISKGNRFISRGIITGPTDTVYSMSGTNVSCELHDEIIGALPGGTIYAAGYPANLEGCTVFDPVARIYVKPVAAWVNATMQNSYANNSNAGYTIDRTGRVQLRGTVSWTAGALQTMFTLPAGFIPAVGKFFVCSYNGGFISIRVLASGAVFLDATPGATMTNINLDTISFYIGS